MKNDTTTRLPEAENDQGGSGGRPSTPGSRVTWYPVSKDPPTGIYLMIADDTGRVMEGIRWLRGWQTMRNGKINVLWWGYLPDHPGISSENAEQSRPIPPLTADSKNEQTAG